MGHHKTAHVGMAHHNHHHSHHQPAMTYALNEAYLQRLERVPDHTAVVRRCAKTGVDVEICYQTFGDAANPCVLLVMGFNAQAVFWDLEFCEQLASRGFFVVRYDNRDVGKSSKFDKFGSPSLFQLLFPSCACACCGKVPYMLVDMAADGMALLDTLKVAQAHIVGISMGGMLAQTMAIEFPHRCLTLTSIASTTGSPDQVEPSLGMKLFLARDPRSNSEVDLATYRVEFVARTGGPRPFDANRWFTLGAHMARRSNYMGGKFRHGGAIVFSGSRVPGLQRVTVPMLIIHGDSDLLVPTANAQQIHNAVRGSKLVLIPNMGHIMFPEDFAPIADLIAQHAVSAASNTA